MGYEYCGIVEEVGREVRDIKPGQLVVGSFATSDNTWVICQDSYQSSSVQREFMSGARSRHFCALRSHYDCMAERGTSQIAETDALHISPFREDGKTYGTPTWIWSVVADDTLYVRACSGQNPRWYQAALRQKAGRISAAGMTKEVIFEPVDGELNDRIDEAYRAKYKNSSYLKPMIGRQPRAATMKVIPRGRKE
jgi:hypothetical protein